MEKELVEQELTIDQVLHKAIEAHKSGKLEEAVLLYQRIIQEQPQHSDANHNLGILAVAVGKAEVALPLFKIALEANLKQEQFWISYINALIKTTQLEAAREVLQQGKNNGLSEETINALEEQLSFSSPPHNQVNALIELYNAGQMVETEKGCLELLETYPQTLVVINLLGTAFKAQGKLAEAVASYDQAIELKPDYINAYYNRGITLQELGKLAEAVASYDQAIQFKPDYAEAYYNRGITLQEMGQLAEAVSSYDQAIELKPNYAEAHNGRATTLQELGKLAEALVSYDQAIELKSDYAEAYSNRGNVLQEMEQLAEAVASYDRAIQIKPDYAEAHNDLGLAFFQMDQLDTAISCFERALTIQPDYFIADVNLGLVLGQTDQLDAAFSCYERALAINPDCHVARFNLSLMQLRNGLLSEGFKNHEARWQWTEFPSARRQFSIPRWTGEPLAGKNILIWGEQGVGDEVMFASLIPEFKDLGCNVGIECASKLVEIFQWSFPWAEVCEKGAVNCEGSEIYSQFDYQIPMGSIAPYFRTTLDDFRTYQKPYFPRLKDGELKVRNKLNLAEGQLLIGLCWRSSLLTRKRSMHYINVEEFASLKAIKGAVFLGLQYDDCMPELDRVRELGLPVRYYTNIDQKNDLASSSALIGACDLVISASTAAYAISGALGVPTIVFWADNNKSNRISWFPTVRPFSLNPEAHQPSGACNFSKINNADLHLTFASSIGSSNVRVYALTYNVLRIFSGMGSVAFSN